jgi:hypothetical protein
VNNPNSTKYVIDANVLIDLALWYPFGCSDGFWSQLETVLQQKKFILLDVIVDEVKYSGPLLDWLKKQKKNGLVITMDDSVKEKAIEINNQYKIIDENTGNSQGDAYLIAFALLNNLSIFTREGHRKNEDDLYKIPDACEKLGIKYIRRPKLFFSNIGYKES